MALYNSTHSGPAVDQSVSNSELLNTYGNGWTKVASSVDSPVNLDLLMNPGNYSINYFTNGHSNFNSSMPLSISVNTVNSVITQYVFYSDGIMRRTYDSEGSTWNSWMNYKQSTYIYIQSDAPTDVEDNTLWIDISDSTNYKFKIYSSSNGWTEIVPSDMMKQSIYDPEGHATDIFSYIDSQLTALDITTTATNLSTHESDTNVHTTLEEKSTWSNKVDPDTADSQIAAALTEAKGYTDTRIAENQSTASTVNTEVSNLTTDLSTHESDSDIHVTSTEKSTWNNAAPSTHTHLSDGKVEIDASKVVSGVLDIARIPLGAIEDVVTVADDTARFALTTDSVQNGDTVYVSGDQKFYFVVDDTNLSNANGYLFYSVGVSSGKWEDISDLPTTISGYGITDAYTKTQVDELISTNLTNSETYTDTNVSNLDVIVSDYGSGITGYELRKLVYGNGLFVVVGLSGTILTSPDGITWTNRTSGTTNSLVGITYANNLYIAIGASGTILTSPDGITWTNRTSGTANSLYGVTYSNEIFIVVGYSGTILTSSDGITWTSQTSGTTNSLYGVIYGNGLFIISGSPGTILTSSDGITWTSQTSGTTNTLYEITYANNLYIAIGASGKILTSPDGITWTVRTSSTSNTLYDIIYADELYVIVGDTGTILTSPDGITWTKKIFINSIALHGISYINGIFYIAGYTGYIYQLTFNLHDTVNTTTAIANNNKNQIDDLSIIYPGEILTKNNYINELSEAAYAANAIYTNDLYVIIGDTGTILTSSDCITWTSQTSGTSVTLYGIIYADGLYIAVGASGTILTSPDAITWTSRTSNTSSELHSIVYYNKLFIIIGDTGTILTSSDGITWTSRTSNVSTFLISTAYGNNKYVISVTGNKILYSSDAITWYNVSISTNGLVSAVLFDNINNIFTCIITDDSDGSPIGIIQSTDGITWNPISIVFPISSNHYPLVNAFYKDNNYILFLYNINTKNIVYIYNNNFKLIKSIRLNSNDTPRFINLTNDKILGIFGNYFIETNSSKTLLKDYVDTNINTITFLQNQLTQLNSSITNINTLYAEADAAANNILTMLG